jgi:hypothetical protein
MVRERPLREHQGKEDSKRKEQLTQNPGFRNKLDLFN